MKEGDSFETKAQQLLQLSEEFTRVAGALARLSIGLGEPVYQHYQCPHSSEPEIPLERVNWLIRMRRKRARYLAPELFAEPAWDILLDLLRAEIAQERISVSSACNAAEISLSTGLRWLNCLEQRGLVLWQCDGSDAPRNFVVLSPVGSRALRRYFLEVVGTSPADASVSCP